MKTLYSLLFIIILPFIIYADDFIAVKDMRGVEVKIPKNFERITTIDDGFVEGVMTHLGVINKVTAIGSWSMKRDYKYSFESVDNKSYTLSGWHTMKYLHNWLNDLPCVNSSQGNIINFETLATSNPDFVILRVGDCTVRGGNQEAINKTIRTIEALKIPLVVIYSPTYFKKPDLSSMKEEFRVLGEVFSSKDKAMKLYDYLNNIENMIIERTKNIKNKDKPSVLYIGLNPVAREKGGAGMVHGINTPESYIIEGIVNAKNAFNQNGSNIILSAEQIYTLNPDVIILPTSNGYHPASELISSKYYQNLSELKAVKSKRVYAMPWSPMNCARRVEYPIDLIIIAKASYPELFKDIKVHEFVLKFYKDVYGVDDKTAKELRSQQILDWTVESDF